MEWVEIYRQLRSNPDDLVGLAALKDAIRSVFPEFVEHGLYPGQRKRGSSYVSRTAAVELTPSEQLQLPRLTHQDRREGFSILGPSSLNSAIDETCARVIKTLPLVAPATEFRPLVLGVFDSVLVRFLLRPWSRWNNLVSDLATNGDNVTAQDELKGLVHDWVHSLQRVQQSQIRQGTVDAIGDELLARMTAITEIETYDNVLAFTPLDVVGLLRSGLARLPRDRAVAAICSEIYEALRRDAEDAAAWTTLEKLVRGIVRRNFWRLDRDTEDDVVADTLARVFVAFGKAHGAETFFGFVYGHFQNVKKALLNRRAKHDQPLGDLDFPAPEEEEGPDQDQAAALRWCYQQLPERYRRAIELRYFEDASYDRIAEELGCTPTNARQIVHRALAILRECVAARLEEPESDAPPA